MKDDAELILSILPKSLYHLSKLGGHKVERHFGTWDLEGTFRIRR